MTLGSPGDIEQAYRSLEKSLDAAKENALRRYASRQAAHPDVRENLGLGSLVQNRSVEDVLMYDLIVFHNPKGLIDERRDFASRACLSLDQGYVAKVAVQGQIFQSLFYITRLAGTVPTCFEEGNAQLLREYGFTKQQGFLVPEHKAVRVRLNDGYAKVDPDGDGWTLAEDASEGETYVVTDVLPHHFVVLDNAAEFLGSYKRHMRKLQTFCEDPHIEVGVHGHGALETPVPALSRMLLARVRDNKGELVIGDLNHVKFQRK